MMEEINKETDTCLLDTEGWNEILGTIYDNFSLPRKEMWDFLMLGYILRGDMQKS